MSATALSRDAAAARLLSRESDIRAFGVKRLALFGSVVRSQARPDSDVDLLIEFRPGEKTFENFFGLALFLEELLERRVEIVTPEFLSPYIGPHILREAEDVLVAA
jgi:uncharacterized protein